MLVMGRFRIAMRDLTRMTSANYPNEQQFHFQKRRRLIRFDRIEFHPKIPLVADLCQFRGKAFAALSFIVLLMAGVESRGGVEDDTGAHAPNDSERRSLVEEKARGNLPMRVFRS